MERATHILTRRKWVLGPEAWVQDRCLEEQPSTWGIWLRSETEWFYLIELNSYQFFSTAVGRIDFKPCVTDCVYIRREAQS